MTAAAANLDIDGRCTRRRRGARSSVRSLIGVGVAFALVVTALVTAPEAGAQQNPPAFPPEGGIIELPYHSEPEYMLVAGDERWSVQNRPQGTLVAGYGRPEGTVDSAYSVTARHEALGTPTGKQLVDVSFRRAGHGLRRSWAFALFADGTAEVWGPIDLGLGKDAQVNYRWTIAPPTARSVVGGIVVNDRWSDAHQEWQPDAVVVRDDGRMGRARFHGNEQGPAVPIAWSATPAVVDGALIAVGREHSVYPHGARGESGQLPRKLHPTAAHRAPAILMILDKGGAFRPYLVGAAQDGFWDGFDWAPALHEVSDDTTDASMRVSDFDLQVLRNSAHPPLLDFDFSCIGAVVNRDAQDADVGPVASRWLPCPAGGATPDTSTLVDVGGRTRYTNWRTVGGRLTVALGVPHQPPNTSELGRRVMTFTVADWLRVRQPLEEPVLRQFAPNYDREQRQACITSDIHPGVFDVRVAVTRSVVACVGSDWVGFAQVAYSDDDDMFGLVSWEQPAGGRYLSTHLQRDARVSVEPRSPVEARTLDVLAQPDPEAGTFVPPTHQERWTDIDKPVVQLQFPCEELLGRPLGTGIDRLPDCPLPDETVTGPARPVIRTTATVAGYATLDGRRRMFVTNLPSDHSWRDQPQAEKADFTWTVEPSPVRATDLELVRSEPESVDLDAFSLYEASASDPPPLLAQVPRDERTPVRIRILSSEPQLGYRPGVPLAFLQAPPVVEGLGQQVDFTPEFAKARSEGQGATSSRATRVGTHAGIEATLMVGAGLAGNKATAGGGFAAEFAFMNEVERAVTESVEFSSTESYGGSFEDHTLVVETALQDEWQAVVIEDPSGLATGHEFTYARPRGESAVSAIPLAQLERDEPDLYGPDGQFRPTIDLILGASRIGDPGSYRPGAAQSQPPSLLAANGGPCIGGYAPVGELTPVNFGLPRAVGPDNPFGRSPTVPTGPSVLLSRDHMVSVGNELTEGATIELTHAFEDSLLATQSFDFSLTGLVKLAVEVQAGVATGKELTISAGFDSGFSTGQGSTTTLATGTSLSAAMGNIPHRPEDFGSWINRETYRWRMFMCQAPLAMLSSEAKIWVQGYVVDNYGGSGGITALDEVESLAPVASAVTRSGGRASPTPVVLEPCSAGPDAVRFSWEQESGTLQRQTLEIEDVSGGTRSEQVVNSWAEPGDFNDHVVRYPGDDGTTPDGDPKAERPGCVQAAADSLVDGNLHRWRVSAQGFVGNRERSDWHYFRPQVWPPDVEVTVRRPIVNADDSVTIDIEQPEGVSSLRYDVVVYRHGEENPDGIVAQGNGVRDRYRTPELPPGSYVATVVGRNSHVRIDGSPAQTDVQRVTFAVEERLKAQFTWACEDGPCYSFDDVAFEDLSLPADDVPITEWFWMFGDGTTSTEQDPVHPYDTPGLYDVRLRVRDAWGRSDVLRQNVRVLNYPPTVTVNLADGDRVRVGEETELHAEVTDPDGDPAKATVSWLLDDGSTVVGHSITHTWTVPGAHTVHVEVIDEHGAATELFIDVHVFDRGPIPDFTWSGCAAQGCTTADFIAFEDLSEPDGDVEITGWWWDFDDMETSTEQHPVHRYSTPRQDFPYQVTLTVHDDLGRSNSWQQPLFVAPTLPNEPPTLELSVADGVRVPVGTPLTMRAEATDPDGDDAEITITWDLADGTIASGEEVTHTWAEAASYTIRVDATDGLGATTRRSAVIEVVERDTADVDVWKDSWSDDGDVWTVGEPGSFTLEVSNRGPGVATDVVVTDVVDDDFTITGVTSDPPGVCAVTGQTVTCDFGDLQHGDVGYVEIWVVPQAAGSYTNTVTATTTSDDPFTHNNSRTIEFTVSALELPDLVVAAISDPPGEVDPGGSFTVGSTTANTGPVTADASVTRFYLSNDQTPAGVVRRFTGGRSVPALAPGADFTRNRTVTVPTNTPPGTYWLLACADDTHLVTESDETNNCTPATSRITIVPA